jgi:hypothetical protein
LITKSEASIAEYGADYTVSESAETIVKYEVWIDTTNLNALNSSASEIYGYQFDMDVDATEVGAFDFTLIAGDNFGFYAANPDNAGITWNSTSGNIAIASATAIVDTNTTNDGPPFFLAGEALIGTFYVNSIDANASSIDITIQDMLVVTDDVNIEQAAYTITLDLI